MSQLTRRRIMAGTAGAALLSSIGPGRRAVGATPGPIKIGMICPMSGPLAAFGRDYKIGFDIAVEQVNQAGGVGGRIIEAVIRDDKGNPTEAVAAARDLAQAGCNLMFGGGFTSTALGPITIMPELNAVFITIGAAADSITHENFNRNTFRITDSNYIRMGAMTRVAAQQSEGIQTWGAVFVDGEGPRNAYAQFRALAKKYFPQLLGREATFVDAITYKAGTSDFKAQITALMSGPAQGIFTNVPGADGVSLFVQARAFGVGNKIQAFIDLGQELLLAKALGPNMPDNFWSASHWYYEGYQDNPMGKSLYQAYLRRTNDINPTGYVAMPYSCVQAYVQAISAAGGKTDSQSVISALETVTILTPKGPLKFRAEDHQEIGDVNVLRFNATKDAPGFKVTDFLKVKGMDFVEPPTPGKPFQF